MDSFVRGGLIATLLCVTSAVTIPIAAQANPPEAPEAPSAQSAAPAQPTAPAQLQPMPAPDPANFTAASPTKATVEAFLHASWGYDANRIFQVQAIQPTQVQGISR
ncbi:MAG TPA: thioredoxin, partial [Acidobacteriaceae bacterium]|nr:thioredoxin [Acidobacteriaceae bacterium]